MRVHVDGGRSGGMIDAPDLPLSSPLYDSRWSGKQPGPFKRCEPGQAEALDGSISPIDPTDTPKGVQHDSSHDL